MTEISSIQQQAKSARQSLSKTEQLLADTRARLRHKARALENLRRQGSFGQGQAEELSQEIKSLQTFLRRGLRDYSAARKGFIDLLETVPDMPWELIEQLPDSLPFLLLPVRVEARFMTSVTGIQELCVRIFPDDIAVHTHEKELTAMEVQDGRSFWLNMYTATQQPDPEQRKIIETGAWALLAKSHGSRRAGWIAAQTRPATLEVSSADQLVFPELEVDKLKPQSWSRAPRSKVMPDRFVVIGYLDDRQIFRRAGRAIPDPLILGPNPIQPEPEIQQVDGELQAGEDIAWIYDFEQAVQSGLGLRIPLDADTAERGLDRLVVLGLRLSSDATESADLVEELIDNHHYAPKGMGLVQQGTPTNNTDGEGSGFSSLEPDPRVTYDRELGPPAFAPVATPEEKSDAQRLAEALGISYDPLLRLENAAQKDVREAMLFNQTLFPATLGYYLEEMLDLDLQNIANIRDFFTRFVTGRGPLPAIRVGTQPYGILLTSNFSAWRWSEAETGRQATFLNNLLNALGHISDTWKRSVALVARIGATTGDPYQNLMSVLGLNPTSVEFYSRQAVGHETIWNLETMRAGSRVARRMMDEMRERAQALLQELGLGFEEPPRLFNLAFFRDEEQVLDPIVDDISEEESEKLSETTRLRALYQVPDPRRVGSFLQMNYLGWLVYSTYNDLKDQVFKNMRGETLPTPRPLLYRLLRSALLLSVHDSATRLYAKFDILPLGIRREVEITNVTDDRTLTRWELMDADVSRVLPQVSHSKVPVGAWLMSGAGRGYPETLTLEEVRRALEALIDLPTARLERIFTEHLDLCSYRLDAWQMGCFARRLEFQRYALESGIDGSTTNDSNYRTGVYLGAFGWLEDLRPAPPMEKADLAGIPDSLHNPNTDGEMFEQPRNAGFIHGPSINHAVTAAVLRSAYLTHFDEDHPEKMAVNLSSQRMRTALTFLEGVRNGQEIGALLGYQFERGLHDRYSDRSLNQYILSFRQAYPLMADKITPDEEGSPVETKEALNVFDGYALIEAAFLRASPVPYPYGVEGLPEDPDSAHGRAIQAEIARMYDSLDAVADLLMAEGVYQVTQGNFTRAAASLKTMTEGGMPPEPEIVRTPRSGAAITQRVALHLPVATGGSAWPGPLTHRAQLEPGLNTWLAQQLPVPENITFRVGWEGQPDIPFSLARLAIQPIDIIYMMGDDLSGQETELEKHLAYIVRREQNDDSLQVRFNFMAPTETAGQVSLFEILPLLSKMRQLVTSSRPLNAADYRLPSKVNTNPAEESNWPGYDLTELDSRVSAGAARFNSVLSILENALPLTAENQPDLSAVEVERLRAAIIALAGYGFQDAVPVHAAGDSPLIRQNLAEQGLRLLALCRQKRDKSNGAFAAAANPSLSADVRFSSYLTGVREITGAAFNLIPQFHLSNTTELLAALTFRDAPVERSLTRYHQEKPLLLEEWLQSAARTHNGTAIMEQVRLFSELLTGDGGELKPLQIPFREGDHWVAVEFPTVDPAEIGQEDVFYPQGEFASIVQWLNASGFDPASVQQGLLVDSWTEVIPGKTETTGIAIHYNQPSSEPPQALLLALTPEITGTWTWEKLEGIVLDTLERAHQRAVEPDLLGLSAYVHLLPAVLAPVTSYPFASIITDFLAAAVSAGSNPSSA